MIRSDNNIPVLDTAIYFRTINTFPSSAKPQRCIVGWAKVYSVQDSALSVTPNEWRRYTTPGAKLVCLSLHSSGLDLITPAYEAMLIQDIEMASV